MSGYILYYKQSYAAEREKAPSSSLGDIAKVIGRSWKALPQAKRDEFNNLARTEALHVSQKKAISYILRVRGSPTCDLCQGRRETHIESVLSIIKYECHGDPLARPSGCRNIINTNGLVSLADSWQIGQLAQAFKLLQY
jgi:hypothetical protein